MAFPFTLPLVLDGATGTELQKVGMPAGVCAERWILDNSQAMASLQRAYADAGSGAVYAPTFSTNRAGLKQHGAGDLSVRELCFRLVDLSREATKGRTLIAGDMSPTGLHLPPVGTTTFDELVDIFTEQAAALDEAGVDYFAVETQMSLAEARASLMSIRSVSDKPITVSFSCGDSGRTIFGGSLAALLVCLQDMGADAFGINCCGDLALITKLLGDMRRYSRVPLIAKPNAGKPVFENGHSLYRMTPVQLASSIPDFIRSGAALVGGCCGTTPEHISAIRSALDGFEAISPSPLVTATCSSEFGVAEITDSTRIEPLDMDDDILSGAMAAEDEGVEVLEVRLRDENDVDGIIENQYAIRLPLCIECDDWGLMDRFLHLYNGKPMIR